MSERSSDSKEGEATGDIVSELGHQLAGLTSLTDVSLNPQVIVELDCINNKISIQSDYFFNLQETAGGEFLRLKNEGNELFRNQKYEEALLKYKEASNQAKNAEESCAILHNQGVTYELMVKLCTLPGQMKLCIFKFMQ